MAGWVRGIGQNLISNVIWWLLVGILSGLAILLTYLTPPVRAYAPLSYLVVALFVLVLAAILANYAVGAWRRYNPPAVGPVQSAVNQTEVEQLRDQMTQVAQFVDGLLASQNEMNDALSKGLKEARERIGALEEKNKIVVQDYNNVAGKQALAEENGGKALKALEDKLEGNVAGIMHRIQQAESDTLDVRRGAAKLEETVEKNEKYVRQSLYAVFAREQLNELATEIERDADDLYLRLKSGEVYTAQEWDQWTNVEHHWERAVKAWTDAARWYGKNVRDTVLTVRDEEYDDRWDVKDNQFPSADAVRRFKRHRIIHRHWQDMKAAVDSGSLKVAYHGETEEEQHGGKFHQ